MKRIFIILLISIATKAYCQVITAPVTPSAQEFLKYGEIPVSEYTGIANISIPIFNIVEDDVTVPIQLTYHSGGIRVTDEASWVGLGWDLNFGSVVQIVMGKDDFTDDPMMSKKLPDYHGSPIPDAFPLRYQYPFSIDGLGWSTPWPVYDPIAMHSFKIATDYWVPINGNFNQQHQDLFDGDYVDSEPDIIKMNFLGHSLNVIMDFDSGFLRVLNEIGYIVRRTNTTSADWGWKVITPDGNTFYFEKRSEAVIDVNYTRSKDDQIGGEYQQTPQIQWFLTKIETTKNKTITFKYDIISSVTNFPSYSQKYTKYDKTDTYQVQCNASYHYALIQPELISELQDFVYRTSQQLPYLTEIEFSKGKILFSTSARDDLLGARKLDGISISNNIETIKQFQFSYDYFVATNQGDLFNGGLIGLNEDKEKKRLKLLSFREVGLEPYEFIYNSTELPFKGSMAIDYWGFYNGYLNNSSLIPNPSRLGVSELAGLNSNNHSANLSYAKACMLEKIIYPTKGSTEFEYELNEFDNYWVPDYSTTSNQTSTGNGLRISAILNKDENGSLVEKTIYHYQGGKSIVPKKFFKEYSIHSYTDYTQMLEYYDTYEIYSSNCYSSNLFGSINGVGYDQVRIINTPSDQGVGNGQRTMNFTNHQDISYPVNHKMMSLPLITDRSKFANGTVLSEIISKREGGTYIPIKEITYDYEIKESEIYYGARIIPYPTLLFRFEDIASGTCPTWYKARHLIGYYPLYSDKTLLKTKEVYDLTPPLYSQNSDVYTKTTYSYTPYNLLYTKANYDEFGNEFYKEAYMYPEYNYPDNSNTLMEKNMLTTVVRKEIYRNRLDLCHEYKYVDKGELTLLDEQITYFQLYPPISESIVFKEHDSKGNVIEYETRKGENVTYIWSYNGQYPVVKAENIDYSILQNAVIAAAGTSDLETFWGNLTNVTYSNSVWNNFNANLRSISNLTDAIVTTYTYDPLVGITSETDPAGRTTYYEYDDFGRLMLIRDQNNNIVEKYDYHYANQ